MKLYFTYGSDLKEGFVPQVPMTTSILADESVDEIVGDYVIEKVPDLAAFIDECYRLLRPGSKAIFTAYHFGNTLAWTSPITKRGISETSLNFASKDWRAAAKFSDCIVKADFEVTGAFSVDQESQNRSDEAKTFWIKRYLNVAHQVIFTLTKK